MNDNGNVGYEFKSATVPTVEVPHGIVPLTAISSIVSFASLRVGGKSITVARPAMLKATLDASVGSVKTGEALGTV